MAPLITVVERDQQTWEATKYQVPITYWYEHYFLKLIAGNDERVKKYKEELFGVGQVEFTPPLYSDYSMLADLQMSEDQFNQLSLHSRARTIVHRHLSGLVELYGRHKQLMKEKAEKRGQGNGAADKPSKQT